MASLLETYGWYEWSCHTNFSFKYGASHPHELVAQAAAFKYQGLAITDFDGVYGLPRSWSALKTLKKDGHDNGLKLFYGAEIHHVKDHDLPLIMQDTLTLIVQSREGYYNLCRLLSYSHRAGKSDADIPLDYLLNADVAGLVAIQPMRGLVKQRKRQGEWQRKCAALRDHFTPERFYLGLSRQFNPAEDHAIRPTLELAKKLGVECLLTQDIFFHHASEKDLADLLQAMRMNLTVDGAVGHTFVNAERSLHSLAGIEARFKVFHDYERMLRSSRQLADSCQFDLKELRYYYPKEMLPEGFSGQQYLEKITWEHARAYYGELLSHKITEILTKELALIEQLGFADYFLTVWDIVLWARSQNILCQGRGSAANSAVCFVLGITAVDPALFDVLFERFISVERGDPPDIDVDFEHERREEVIQYIYERYGREKAAMVANVITFQSRGALRASGKALGIPEVILGKASDILDSREFRRGDAERVMEELKVTLKGDDEDWDLSAIPFELWAEMCSRIGGFPSHLGIHSGGFILADRALDWLVPQEPATMAGRTVIQWCKEDIEALGFFKIDVLALGMLTAIRKCFDLIKGFHGRDYTLASIPQGDKPTYDMICKADTVGTFQIESRAQMSMLPRLKPRCFYDLVIEVAIIRPGPIQGGMIHPFLKRRDGLEKVTFPDPRIEPILKRTLGIPIFQEQVMRIAIAIGGFSPGEADELRRNMGSFSMKGDVGRWLGKLADGMRKHGIAEHFIQTILSQMKGFSSYGFPESHAASFALLAYASSYLKCHYPAAFFVALINSQPMGFYAPHVLLQTARHLGIKVLPVCVNKSDWDFTLEPVEDELCIRMGLRIVRSLRDTAGQGLVSYRKRHGQWRDLYDFIKVAGLSRLDITALAAADALQVFGIERRAAIWLSEAAPFAAFLEDEEPAVYFEKETNQERLQSDFAATSTSLGLHPTEILKNEAWCYEVETRTITLAKDVPKRKPGQILIAFGMVIVRQAPPAAKGLVFATIEDETGLINLAFMPQVYAQYRRLFDRQAFLCLRGVLQRQGDAHSIKVTHLFAPEIKEAKVMALNGDGDMLEVAAAAGEKELIQSRNYC
jgi:error-prone DNA polymerase